jgi:hypothetical protein
MKSLEKVSSALLLTLLASCGSPMMDVEIRTDPPGANVWINGDPQGVTPRKVTFDFTESERNLLQLHVTGRPPVEMPFTRSQLPRGNNPLMVNIAR